MPAWFRFPADEAQRIRLALGALLACGFAARFANISFVTLRDPDTLWHIAVGRDLLATWDFPVVDAYSHSFAGAPWIAKEWLSQVLLAGAHDIASWNGVVALTVATLAFVIGYLYWSLSRRLKPVTAAIVVAGCTMLFGHVMLARPHIISLPLLIIFVERIWAAGAEGRRPPFWLLGVLVVWANMHASFTFGFVAAFLAACLYLLRTRDFTSRRTQSWALFLVLCPLVSMIHPYGYESIWSTVSVAESEALGYITEWRPFAGPDDPFHQFALLGFIFFIIVTGFRTNIVTAAFLCLMTYMFFQHARFAYILFALAPVILAEDLARQFRGVAFAPWAAVTKRLSLEAFMGRRAEILAAGSAALIAVALGWVIRWGDHTPPPSHYPLAAIEAARVAGVTGNVLNHYDFGGGLIYEGVRTFVDGRADRLFQNGFMDAIDRTQEPGGEAELLEQLTKYDIGWSMLRPSDYRVDVIGALPGWRTIFEDEFVVVQARFDAD